MSEIVKEYYEKAQVKPFLIEHKMKAFEKHPDICREFEEWISTKKFVDNVVVDGYTASAIAKLSPNVAGEGAFMMLIELRENPVRAKKLIEDGFAIV